MKHRMSTIASFPVLFAAVALTASACADGPVHVLQPEAPNFAAVKFWESTATARWNARVAALLTAHPPANGQAAAVRLLAYLSVAQYRAVLAAESDKDGSTHPSSAAAVGGASVAVLSAFFPSEGSALNNQLAADLAAEEWPGARHEDDVSGEAIGRAIGASVVTLASSDNYLAVAAPAPPVGPGFWIPNGPVVRALYGVRPFFLTSADQLRPPPPPAFGSAAFQTALDEVRAISDSRSQTQIDIALKWNTPFTAATLNGIGVGIIRDHHRTEREAARILAYANVAMFDAQIACWDAKLTYWFIRPRQADGGINLVFTTPNHPSYPSGHSCLTSAFMTVVADAFPSEQSRLDALITEAGMSRVYAGIHYRFDVEAGQGIGRGAAALALAGRLE